MENRRILVVEDNDINLLVASGYLDKGGYLYDTASSGPEAIAKAQTHAYDLILMDISMPDMDGFEAAQRIRALGGWAECIPILALSAHAARGFREKYLAAGINDHVGKPLDYGELAQKLDLWLGRSSVEAFAASREGTPSFLPDLEDRIFHRLVSDLGTGAALRIADAFLDRLDRHLEHFKSANVPTDLVGIAHAAHTLKSSGGHCGLMRFSALMAELEAAASAGEANRVKDLLCGLGPVCSSAKRLLSEECSKYRG